MKKSGEKMKRVLRKRVRRTLVAVLSLSVVVFATATYLALDLLGRAGRTDVDIVDQVTVPAGSLDDITEQPEDVIFTEDPDATGGAATKPRSVLNRNWGQGICPVFVVSSIPIQKVAQKVDGVENILVFGVDSRSASTKASRTDTMMIVTIDTRNGNKTIKLTSLLRDTQVDIAGRTLPNKLNTPYVFGGIGLMLNTINATFDLDIQKFIMIDLSSAEHIIDMTGGIEVNVLGIELEWLNININETNNLFRKDSRPKSPNISSSGLQILDGRQAVAYGRIRKIDSDFQRTTRQRYVAKQLLKAFLNATVDRKYTALQAAFEGINTNMTYGDMFRIASDTVSSMPTDLSSVREYKVPASGMYTEDRATFNLVMNLPVQIADLHRFIWSTSTDVTTTPESTPEVSPEISPTFVPSPTLDATPASTDGEPSPTPTPDSVATPTSVE
jgi:LCP family protein required for cell wall assembly